MPFAALSVASLASVLLLATTAVAQNGPPRPNNEPDHQNMMAQLGIKELRQGANGNDPKAPNAANYDESKASLYGPVPELLKLKNGDTVKTADDWWEKRRPEIVEDFDREIYGRMPQITPAVRWEVTSTSSGKLGEHATIVKQLVGHVDNSAFPSITVDIPVTLTLPADARGPVPVIMEYGFSFGRPTSRPGATRPAFPPQTGPSWQEQVIARGWAAAVITPTAYQADNGAGLTQGIIGLCNRGQSRKPDDWGALRAWGWGASRALDYFETDPAVDAKKVVIEGLSRYGKAAIVTMAQDSRFAIAFVGSSGEGGVKIHRRNFGEMVENVAASGEYHWMAGNFMKYAGPLTPNDLPVDSHQLVALCAPRPVFVGAGVPAAGDGWVDAKGMFLGTALASPAYELLGHKGLGTMDMPAVGSPLVEGDLAWSQHAGGHTNGPNWPTFLNYAQRYFK